MTTDIATEHEIRRLHDVEKWKRGTIVAELGVHADVVDRVLDSGAERPLVLAPRPTLVDPFEAYIDETLRAHPRLRATRLFDMIRIRGYDGGIAILRRHVAEVRPVSRGEVYLRIERLIGEQAQIDWAHVGSLAVTGGTRPLWVFVMVLAYSRAMWAELVFDLTVESLRRSLVRAARFFDGVTRQWLFDNPKTVVLARHGDAVRYHPGLLEIAGALRVQPRLCRPRRPTDKGGVERANRYLHDRFFAARVITSIEDGNRQLLEFIRDIANARPHPRFRDRTVAEVFAEEKERLLALPATLPETDCVFRSTWAASPRVPGHSFRTPGRRSERSDGSSDPPEQGDAWMISSWSSLRSRLPVPSSSCPTVLEARARERCGRGGRRLRQRPSGPQGSRANSSSAPGS